MTDNNTFYKTLNDLPLGGGKLAAEVDDFFAKAKEYIHRREIDHISCDTSIRAAELDVAKQLPEVVTSLRSLQPNFPSIAATDITHSVIDTVYHTLQLLGKCSDESDEQVQKKMDPVRKQGKDGIKTVQCLLEEIVNKCGPVPAPPQSCNHSQHDDCSCPWRPHRKDEPAMRQFLGDFGLTESQMKALDAICNFEAQSSEFVEEVLQRLDDAEELPSRKDLPGAAKLDIKAVTKAINDLKKMLGDIDLQEA